MSVLQESLMSNPDVYAGGSGTIPLPEFDPADEFVPDNAPSVLLDGDDIPAPAETIPEPVDVAPVDVAPVDVAPVDVPPIDEPPVTPTETPVRNKQDFLHRLNTKNAKLAANAARIAELEGQLAGTAPAPVQSQAPAQAFDLGIPDLEARRQRVLDLTIDGNTSEAAALQSQIDRDVIQATVRVTTQQVLESVNNARESASFDEVLADIAVTYPELDETGEVYDTKTARMINAVMAEYMDDDHSRQDALRLATDEVMRLKYPSYFTEAPAQVAAPARAAAPVRATVAKSAAAAVAQPALPVGSASARAVVNSPKDIFSMTDAEFAKLTPEEISELRGDNL